MLVQRQAAEACIPLERQLRNPGRNDLDVDCNGLLGFAASEVPPGPRLPAMRLRVSCARDAEPARETRKRLIDMSASGSSERRLVGGRSGTR